MLAAMEALLARKRRRWPGVPSGRADLHVHSIWSDGAQHPDDIVRAAAGRVEVVAVTDHDEIRGVGIFSWFYDAVAAMRNVEWMLPVTGSSDAHDVWYLGSAMTHFAGRDAQALRRALVTRRTRARVNWSWSVGKLPRHVRIQSRSAVRFLWLWGQRKTAQWPG